MGFLRPEKLVELFYPIYSKLGLLQMDPRTALMVTYLLKPAAPGKSYGHKLEKHC